MTDRLNAAVQERSLHNTLIFENNSEVVMDSLVVTKMFEKKHNNVKRDIHETILKLDELKQSEAVLSPQVKAEIRKGPSEEAKRALMHFMMRTSVPRIAAQRIKERGGQK
ncbi:hypothetical protein FOL75_07065 [Bacillus thuringiensis]|uniref:hypothetical protein n=1 Tax=Bacillus cereus group TaxID=86661 RepID=UPI002853FF6B|nr:hypothetical protein [Bacillus thuringiensis]MDR5021798.1 hypothetical protein [Bacillus thuringiensis]